MKVSGFTKDQIEDFLQGAQVGRFITQNPDGFPYAVPVHYVYEQGKIYFHGRIHGQKMTNIRRNPQVCFEVDEMLRINADDAETACQVGTRYNSVVAFGYAKVIEEIERKNEILIKIVDKYTPQFSGEELSENSVKATAVVEIELLECSGKSHK